MSTGNLTSPSRSSTHTGWANPTEYDEGEDPFDPFSNYQYGNGYEGGVDSVTQRLQAVSSFIRFYLLSHDPLGLGRLKADFIAILLVGREQFR